MANRFWVPQNGTLTWAATGPTNWGSSSGTSDGASVPGTGDVAIFDGNSGVGNSIIGANITVQGLDCTGGTGSYAGTITHNTSVTLTINTGAASSLRFSAGMTYTAAANSSLITLTHTSGTANITCAGQSLGALTINGAGGTTTLLDALLVNKIIGSILTLTAGTLDAATNNVAITANNISSSNSNTRALSIGSGNISIGGANVSNVTIWQFTTTTNLTWTKGTGTMTVLSPTSTIATINFAGGGLTYNALTLQSTSVPAIFTITGANTFPAWTIGSGWSIQLPAGTTTVSTGFSLTGTAASPVMLSATGFNTGAATLSVPAAQTVMASWAIIGLVAGTGGATFIATNSFNLNISNFTSGWSITPPGDSSTTLLPNTVTSLDATMSTVAKGTVTTGASTTSVPTSAFTINGTAASGVVADEFKNRVVIFRGDTTTAGLRGAQATISANTASDTPTLTVGTLPATPAAGDIFRVV